MARVNFQYRSNKKIAFIEVRFSYHDEAGKRKHLGTRAQYEIEKEYFDKWKKNGDFSDIDKSNKLTDIKREVSGLYSNLRGYILNAYKNESGAIDKDWLKNVVDEYYNPKEETELPTKLLPYFDYFLSLKEREVKTGTLRKWKVVRNKIARFEKDKRKKYFIKDVNSNFLKSFQEWSIKNEYENSTTNRNFRDIKAVCTHARTRGVEVSNEIDYLSSNLKKEKKFIITLSIDELERIHRLNGLPNYLDNAKDWLLISCYTGQRISDFMRFNTDMIRTEQGRKFIDITQEKTGKNVSIPLLPIVQKTLDKRNEKFPHAISHVKYNEYIKEVCKLAKIDEVIEGKKEIKTDKGNRRKEIGFYPKYELITSHTGRRSFATNFYGKLPTSFLKDITAHSTESMLLNYIGKTSKDTAIESYDILMKSINSK
ncbi:MAG: site-specific integrase [Brumimicrobium sp.]|nr:site-specific integrase [Brumimicrobium sp.]